jgi:two-component system, cell cycle sensor histidine kinase and response regulator CckA
MPISQHAAARLAAIIESSKDAIVSKDLNGIVETWNAGAEHIYGYTAAEVIGKPMHFLLPPERWSEEDGILERLRRGEAVQHFDTSRIRKDGREIHISLAVSPVRDSDGIILGVAHVARDITEKKQFEQRLQQSQRLESLGVLAGGIAHDFNNLLTGILGNASIVGEIIPAKSPAQEFLHDMITAGQRLSDLTRQLLAYAGRGTLNTTDLNLVDLVREISTLIQASIPKHVQVRLQLEPVPSIKADPSQIQQIIMNLIINGAEAIPTETFGSVLVSTGFQAVDQAYIETTSAPKHLQPGPYVYLEVHDTGMGMDAETQAHIFEPFFTTKVKGRGLGLSAVLGIIHSHKGAIKVYSQPGKGSTFKILLPSVEPALQAAPSVQQALRRGTGTILVVDDEEVVRKVAKAALELYGYSVILANDGKEALDIFHQRDSGIDLVLLDLIMPNMGGEETYRQLKLRQPDLRVILSSGYSDTQAQARFAGKGLASFIKKPYTAAALREIVQRAMNTKHDSLPNE